MTFPTLSTNYEKSHHLGGGGGGGDDGVEDRRREKEREIGRERETGSSWEREREIDIEGDEQERGLRCGAAAEPPWRPVTTAVGGQGEG
ncbi:hypothetical protein AgCh_000446 [Apium graveolens]